MDAARRDGLQRAVPRRPADPHRLAVVCSARGRRALDRLPPVLRALPGAARPHGPSRHPAERPAAGRSRRRAARPRGGAPAVAHAPQPRARCRTSISTPAPRTATRADDDGRLDRLGCPDRPAAAGRPHRQPACARSPDFAGSRPTRSGPTTPTTRATPSGDRVQGAPSSSELLAIDRARRPSGTSAPTPAATAGSPPRQADSVLAFDIDPAAAERNYRQLRQEQRADILPLVMDLANPSPGLGWASGERRSLVDRAERRCPAGPRADPPSRDLAKRAAAGCCVDLFADLAAWAVVEFVPKEDPMVRHLLATPRGRLPGLHARRVPGGGRQPVHDRGRAPDRGEPPGPVAAPASLTSGPAPASSGVGGRRSVISTRSYGRV